MTTPRTIGLGILGCGNVGAAFVELVQQQREAIAERSGVDIEIRRIAIRKIDAHRPVKLLPEWISTDPLEVVSDASVDIVVELMGGVDAAGSAITAALNLAKPVVTANKALLASPNHQLWQLAARKPTDLFFEASVGGGIPLVRALQKSLAGEPISRVMGIVNGTTNYILTKMTETSMSYADALDEAQQLGYAEANPSADVDGHDAAAKAAVLAALAFGAQISGSDVATQGIANITAEDIIDARRLGHVIKLLAIVERDSTNINAPIAAFVSPTMVPITHPLAAVREAFNAVFIEGDSVGEIMLYGRGAGGAPTASAVLGDVINAAQNLASGKARTPLRVSPQPVLPQEDTYSAYYLTVEVEDEPGVLAQVALIFGQHTVSIRSMEQQGLSTEARLIFITHKARHANLLQCVADLKASSVVRKVGDYMRVIGD